MTVSAMKMAAEQQTKIADLLAQNTAQLPQSTAQNTEFTFSTYA
jgi:hypothetical protein